MFLSENEIAEQLAALHRQRELIERKIADLLLFRELGRRLSDSEAVGSSSAQRLRPVTVEPEPEPGDGAPMGSVGSHDFDPPRVSTGSGQEERREPRSSSAQPEPEFQPGRRAGDAFEADSPAAPKTALERRAPPVPAVSFEEDPVAARRYGRALLEAVLDVLRELGRPLHAGEILERVVARGFTVPGHDPVAALNTRLWKRSGPGKPLRRLGEAVYALSDPPPP